jgi:hypothetical protein
MKRIIGAAIGAIVACSAQGQALTQRKPGLWELQYSVQGGEMQAGQAQMAEKLANMPPEKRAQMEAYMQQHGMGITVGPGGSPMMTMRFCLTPQDIAEQSARSLLKGMHERDCNAKILSHSPREVHVHAVCPKPDEAMGEVDARIYDLSPEHYAVEMKARGPRGDIRMQQKARWLGNDCKGAAF